MPRLQYNLDDITDAFPEIPAGRHRAQLTTVVKGVSNNSGQPVLTWTWTIQAGEAKGSTVRSWTSLQDHALQGLKQHLLALGLKGSVNQSTDRLIGKSVTLVVGKREGTTRAGEPAVFDSVLALLPIKASAPQDDDDEEDYDDEDEVDDEEDEEQEEEPEPAPARRRRRSPAGAPSSPEPDDDDGLPF